MNKKINAILLFAVLVFSITGVFAQTAGSCPMMYGAVSGNYGGLMLVLSWITWILVIVLLVAAIYWLIKSAQKKK